MPLGVAPPAHHVLLLLAERRHQVVQDGCLGGRLHVAQGVPVQVVDLHVPQLQQPLPHEGLVQGVAEIGQGQRRKGERVGQPHAAPPPHALRGVLEDDAHGLELVADPVGLGEVARLAGLLPGGNQGLDLGIQLIRRGLPLQEPQHPGQFPEQGQTALGQGRRSARPDLAVELPAQLEDDGQPLRRVEVVVHRLDEAVVLGALAQQRLLLRGQRRRGHRCGPGAPAFVPCVVERSRARSVSATRCVAEVERGAVVGREQEQAEDLARRSASQSRTVSEVAQRLGHLLAVDDQEAVVHPVARRTACR